MAGFNLPPLGGLPETPKLKPITKESQSFGDSFDEKIDNEIIDLDDDIFNVLEERLPTDKLKAPRALGEGEDEDIEDLEELEDDGIQDLYNLEDEDDEDNEEDEELDEESTMEELPYKTVPVGLGVADVVGVIEGVRVNKEKELTAIKFRRDDDGELIYLQEDQMNPLLNGERVVASINLDSKTTNGKNIAVYDAISVIPVSIMNENDDYEEPNDEVKPPSNPKGLKGILQAIKAEYASKGQGQPSQPDEDTEEEADEDEENPEPIKPKLQKKGRNASKRNLYIIVADFLYDTTMSILNSLSKIPLIGKVFALLKSLDGIFKLLSRLWLIILIVIILLTTGLINKVKGKVDGTTLSKGNVTLQVTKPIYADNKITMKVKNTSKVYADFYLTSNVRSGLPLIGKKTTCESEFTVLSLDQEKEITLVCKSPQKQAKVTNTDIQLNN